MALAAVGLGVGLGVAFGGGSGRNSSAPTATTISAEALQSLFETAKVGEKEKDLLAKWPAPYQHYRDNLGEDCYEWRGANLYDLCFRAGVLHLKTTF